jgi:undecaprenyl diphosphate synthase
MDLEGIAKIGPLEAELARGLDLERLPKHVAVIMDGNGRWARERSLPRVAGHRAGIEAVQNVVEASARLGLQVLTLYAFSVENWKRPRSEVRTLMNLLKEYVRRELDNIHKHDIRFIPIGRVDGLDSSVQQELHRATEKTKANSGMILSVALNYGGRTELVDAFNRLRQELDSNGHSDLISEDMVAQHLYTSGIPDPDLLIRTSGEMRVSNFLLWQIAYSEIYVTPTLWPDFRVKDFLEAIHEYQRRNRRYGGI